VCSSIRSPLAETVLLHLTGPLERTRLSVDFGAGRCWRDTHCQASKTDTRNTFTNDVGNPVPAETMEEMMARLNPSRVGFGFAGVMLGCLVSSASGSRDFGCSEFDWCFSSPVSGDVAIVIANARASVSNLHFAGQTLA
jgi:hypothetical protein